MEREPGRAWVGFLSIGLLTLGLVWVLSWQWPETSAHFAFQSPETTDTPIGPSATEETTPSGTLLPEEQGTPTGNQERRPVGPRISMPGTPPREELSALRSLALAFGYVWLGCGIWLLLAIPVGLAWLHWRGRHIKP
jgi:hypothetical protein